MILLVNTRWTRIIYYAQIVCVTWVLLNSNLVRLSRSRRIASLSSRCLLPSSIRFPIFSSRATIYDRLAEFGWFHKIDSGNETVTPEIDDLLLRSTKTAPEGRLPDKRSWNSISESVYLRSCSREP